MGMFDYVNVKMLCPHCGQQVSGFQSKDSVCELLRLSPNDVDYFYTYCDSCKCRITASRPSQIKGTTKIYTLTDVLDLGFTVEVELDGILVASVSPERGEEHW